MKMSDYFRLPISNRSVKLIQFSETIESKNDGVNNYAAIHAINNHDRLTSENARLREIVKAAYIEGSKSGYSDGLSDGQSWSSNKSSSDPDGDWEYSDAKQLLTELEKCDE